MRWRVPLEPVRTISQTAVATTYIQEARFAREVGKGTQGQAFVNVYRNTIGGTITFDLDTTSNIEVAAVAPGGASALWVTTATSRTIGASAVGVAHFASFSKLGEYIRWRVSTPAAAGALDFDVVLYLEDSR